MRLQKDDNGAVVHDFVLPLPGSTAVPDSIDCHVKKTSKKSLKLCLQDVREN